MKTLWRMEKSIFVNWVKLQYIKRMGLEDVNYRPKTNSQMWNDIIEIYGGMREYLRDDDKVTLWEG